MRRKITAAGLGLLAVAGAGAAVAGTGLVSPQEESKAVVEDAASQLGVDASELSDALKQALENRVDAAVADGSLTEEQGEALKARIEAQDYPLLGMPGFGPRGGPVGHGFGHLDAAASYLGLTEEELRTELEDGQTLAEVAAEKGKSVDGLVSALVADQKQELDEAVADGRLTQAQADELLENAHERLTDLVNGDLPDRGHPPFGRPGSEPASSGWLPRDGAI